MIYTNNAECEIIFLRSSLFNRTGRIVFPDPIHTFDILLPNTGESASPTTIVDVFWAIEAIIYAI